MIAFGNLPTNPAVFTQKTFHWVDTVSMSRGNHNLKFGGEVRHVRDDSDFAVRRPDYQFCQRARLRDRRSARGHRSSASTRRTGLIEPNIRNFRFWETRRLLPGRLEDPVEPDAEPRHPARVVRASVRGERSADQHHPRSRRRHLRAGAHRDGRPRRSGRAQRLQQLRAAHRLLVGSARRTARLAVRGGYGIAYERLFNNSITNIRFNPPFYAFTVATR